MEQFWTATATTLKRAIQERRLGVEQLARAYLKRIEAFDGPDGLNVVAELYEQVLAQARRLVAATDRSGPIFGLTILVKDDIDAARLHTTAGSPALTDNLAARDATVVA